MNAQRGVLLLVIATLLFLTFQLVAPFLSFVIGALLLAYVLTPLQTRLETRVEPTTAAAILVVAATVALLLPFVALVITVAGEALTIARDIAADDVAAQLRAPEAWLNDRLGRNVDLSAEIATRLEGLAETVVGTAPDLVASLTHLTIGLGLSVFLLFYLLRDGDQLVDWLQAITPLPQSVQATLYDRIDSMTRAVLLGHVLVAIIQGGIAGLGLVAVGISNAVFWTVLMILLSLLPFVGAFLVWGPAAVYLASVGRLPAAAFLFVYGAVVVGVSDEYLRPVIVDRYANVSPAVIVIGVLGGLSAFGVMGLFVGPIVIGVLGGLSAFGVMGLFVGPIVIGALKAALEVFDEQYERI